jgi:t-SNARE complex subunit (syntaxin)
VITGGSAIRLEALPPKSEVIRVPGERRLRDGGGGVNSQFQNALRVLRARRRSCRKKKNYKYYYCYYIIIIIITIIVIVIIFALSAE